MDFHNSFHDLLVRNVYDKSSFHSNKVFQGLRQDNLDKVQDDIAENRNEGNLYLHGIYHKSHHNYALAYKGQQEEHHLFYHKNKILLVAQSKLFYNGDISNSQDLELNKRLSIF